MGLDRVVKRDLPLICPFRHPYRVEESWLRQGRGTSDDLAACFRLMFEKCIPLGPYIMPVDSPMREECLKELEEGLGLTLKTEWQIQNSKAGTHDMDLSEFTPSPVIIEFTKEIHQFLGKYYGNQTRARK